jgi:hypothetical protein
VAVGDFNRDGKLDLVVSNSGGGGTVSLLLGDGKGGFSPAAGSPFTVGAGAQGLVVGDFNGDGNSDVAVACTAGVIVLLGNGKGSFGAPSAPFAAGTTPFGLATADLRGLGVLDLVVSNSGSNNVSILLGTGNGTFGAATNVAVGTTPMGVAVADVNGDGHPDIVVANSGSHDVSVLLGKGDGTFPTPVDNSYVGGSAAPVRNSFMGGKPTAIVIADVNGDGRPDLVVTDSPGGRVFVLLGGLVNGFFAPTLLSPMATGPSPVGLVVADFTGSGRLDLATVNHGSSNVSLLLSR